MEINNNKEYVYMGNPKYDQMSNLVATLLERDGPEAALSRLNDGLKKAPNLLEAYLVRGELYMEMGAFQKALNDFENAIKLNPSEPKSYFLRGSLYARSGSDVDIDKAIADFNKTIELDANHLGAYTNREKMYVKKRESQKVVSDDVKTVCYSHSSKEAVSKCVECGKPICEDCHNRYDGYCYDCCIVKLEKEISEYENKGRMEKAKMILVIVFSAIGFIVGVISDVSLGSMGWLIWLGVGVGGNFRKFLSEIQLYIRAADDDLIKGVGFGILLLLLKSLAGPIIPIIRILEYVKDVKTAEDTVANDTDLISKLTGYNVYTYILKNTATTRILPN